MIIDKLFKAVEEKGNVCVGLDTDVSYIPQGFVNKFETLGDAVYEFNKAIVDATYDQAACYKLQIAYYEALGMDGLKAYSKTLKYIKSVGAISIGDIKRGDIAKTAEMYAKAHFEGEFEADFVTLNPYMGFDTIEPYMKYIENGDKGIFVLVRTSNKGSGDIQSLQDSEGREVYETVGKKLEDAGKGVRGECGYSSIGAVVGCTCGEDCKTIRQSLKHTFFLIPGYGAQGGKSEDVANCLMNLNGGIVNSSRGILLAYRNQENGEERFAECAREEVIRIKNDISRAAAL